MKYLPPPFLNARYGNLHTLPRPTAYPTQVRMNSSFPPQFPRCSISFSFISVVDFMFGSVIKEKGAVESFDPSWPNFMGSVIRESGALASFSPLWLNYNIRSGDISYQFSIFPFFRIMKKNRKTLNFIIRLLIHLQFCANINCKWFFQKKLKKSLECCSVHNLIINTSESCLS